MLMDCVERWGKDLVEQALGCTLWLGVVMLQLPQAGRISGPDAHQTAADPMLEVRRRRFGLLQERTGFHGWKVHGCDAGPVWIGTGYQEV